MEDAYIAGLFGFIGVLVGGIVQFWFTRRATTEARYLELKSEAYADYINAVALSAFVEESQRSDMRQRLASSKSRISVFGDKSVLEVMKDLELTSLNLSNPDARAAFLKLVRVMRAHSIATNSISDDTLVVVLFGNPSEKFKPE